MTNDESSGRCCSQAASESVAGRQLTGPLWWPHRMLRGIAPFEGLIRRRRYGVIHTVGGRFESLTLRPWPMMISLPEIWWDQHVHRPLAEDQCKLYFDQPLFHSRFVAVKYLVAGKRTRPATVLQALHVLDRIARIKQIDALLCQIHNARISDRLLCWAGFEPHRVRAAGRHYIKRFEKREGDVLQ